MTDGEANNTNTAQVIGVEDNNTAHVIGRKENNISHVIN